jgi:Flp pilus assembly protein TadB
MPDPAPARQRPDEQGPVALLQDMLGTGQRLAADLIELFGLEARLASGSLALLLAAGLGLGVLMISAWILFWAALAVLAGGAGVRLFLALLVVALVNLIGAFALLLWMRRLGRDLLFRESRAAVRGETGRADLPEPSP